MDGLGFVVPEGATDCHMHIFGDMSEDLDEKVTDRFTTIIGG